MNWKIKQMKAFKLKHGEITVQKNLKRRLRNIEDTERRSNIPVIEVQEDRMVTMTKISSKKF